MAPRTISRGAKSPPIASTAMRISRPASALAFGRRGWLDDDRLAAVVIPAGRTDVVRELQLMAMRALDQRRRADRQVRAPLTLPCLRDLSLGNAHARLLHRYIGDAA